MKKMRHALSLRASILAVAIAAPWAPTPATGQIGAPGPGNNYYPRTDAPVNGDPALALIESLLHDQFRKVKDTSVVQPNGLGQIVYKVQVPSLYAPDSPNTPVLPPLPGDDRKTAFPVGADHYILATDLELDAALGSAVQKMLDNTIGAIDEDPVTPGVQQLQLKTLVKALASYKKTTVSVFIKTATTNILNWNGAFGASLGGGQTAALEQLTAAACEAEPANAAKIVATMLPLVVPKVKGGLTNNATIGGGLGTADAVKFGLAQLARTDSNITPGGLTAQKLSSALNSLPGVLAKGGVTVAAINGNADLQITFGQTSATISGYAAAVPADVETALMATGLSSYGKFTVAADTTAGLPPSLADDMIITFKPLNLNVAGGTNRDLIPGYSDAADDIVREAVKKSTANAVAIVTTALGIATQGVDVSGDSSHDPVANGTYAKAKDIGKRVAAAAILAAYEGGAGYLGDEVATAIGTKLKATSYLHKVSDTNKKAIVTSTDVTDTVFSDAARPTDLKEIALIGAGLMKGFKGSNFEGVTVTGFAQASGQLPEVNIAETIKTKYSGQFGTNENNYVDNVKLGFQNAYGLGASPIGGASSYLSTNPAVVGKNLLNQIAADSAYDFLSARLTGAAAWLPGVLVAKTVPASSSFPSGITFTGGNFIANLLQVDSDHNNTDTVANIIETAVRASSANAATVANLATIWAKSPPSVGAFAEPRLYGQITRGTALGLKGQPLYNTILNGAIAKIFAGRGAITKVVPPAITTSPTGPDTTTSASTAVGLKTITVSSTSGIVVGQAALGANIPAGAVVSSIVGNVVTISKAVTGTGVSSGASVSFKPLLAKPVVLVTMDSVAQSDLKEITSYAVAGVNDAGHPTAAAGAVATLAKAASSFHQYYLPILQGAIDASAGGGGALPASEQWRAVLAVMSARKLSSTLEFDGTYDEVIVPITHPKPTANMRSLKVLIQEALAGGTTSFPSGITGYNPSNATPISKGANVIDQLQLFPKAVFNKAYIAFTDGSIASDETSLKAVLTGVGLISPTSASLGAALAVKVLPTSAAQFEAEAIAAIPALSANIKVAVATAKHVASPGGTADLFNFIDTSLAQNPKYQTEVLTAATAVAPQYVHIIAHAVGFRTPASVAKFVPQLFNYSHLTSTDVTVAAPLGGEYDNKVDAAAAISAAITAGILEAKTGYVSGSSQATKQVVEITFLKSAIVALVKQTLTMEGNTPVNSPWLIGTNAALSFGASGDDSAVGGGEGSNNFRISDGSAPTVGGADIFSSGYTKGVQTGPAGVITGFMTQMIKNVDTRLPFTGFASGDLGPVAQVIGAAIGVVKSDVTKMMAIAQAAAQAARGISPVFSSDGVVTGNPDPFLNKPYGQGEYDILLAILNVFTIKVAGLPVKITETGHPNYVGYATISNVPGGKPNPYFNLFDKLSNAIHFGVLAAENNVPGAGAAGVLNYTLVPVTGSPVTDIFGL